MGDKSVETLSNKIEFLTILVTFSPFPPKQCWFFYFFDCTDHSAYTTLNWGAGGIRELTLEANKIEQMLKYRKASFPKSVSTTFVAHCSFVRIDACCCPYRHKGGDKMNSGSYQLQSYTLTPCTNNRRSPISFSFLGTKCTVWMKSGWRLRTPEQEIRLHYLQSSQTFKPYEWSTRELEYLIFF